MSNTLVFALAAGLVAVGYGLFLASWILKRPTGDEKMRSIAAAIQEGAKAYLGRQTRTLAYVAIVLALVIWWGLGQTAAIGFAARERAAEFPGWTISSVKRLMGRSRRDAQPDLAYLPYEVIEGGALRSVKLSRI